MRIDLPPLLANTVRTGKATAQLVVFVNGQYMVPELGYRYAVNADEVVIKFEGLGETLAKLSALAQTSPQLIPLLDANMVQVSIVQYGHGQWHWKDEVWTLYVDNDREVYRRVGEQWQKT